MMLETKPFTAVVYRKCISIGFPWSTGSYELSCRSRKYVDCHASVLG